MNETTKTERTRFLNTRNTHEKKREEAKEKRREYAASKKNKQNERRRKINQKEINKPILYVQHIYALCPK